MSVGRALFGQLRRLKAGLLAHSAAGRAARNVMWPKARESDGVAVASRARRDVFGSNDPASIRDRGLRELFAGHDRDFRFQEDAIFQVGADIVIEPRHSLAILPGRRLVTELQGVHPEVMPGLADYARYRMSGGEAEHHDALIHFDGFLGSNLWHFFADAFHGLMLIDRSGLVARDVPILIHKRIWDLPIARHLLTRPPYADRRWVVQDRQWVRTAKLYKGQAAQAWFRDSYDLIASFTTKGGDRKIFLNRRELYGRTIANIDEIEAVTAARGFETVYAEDLGFDEQVRLFAGTRAIVAIHGAGLTNCLFADASRLRCLEIHTASYLNPHYYWMLQMIGAERYDAIVGSKLDSRQRFRVDGETFKRQLAALMD